MSSTCLKYIAITFSCTYLNSNFKQISNESYAYMWPNIQAYSNNILRHIFDKNHIFKKVQSNAI